MSVPNIIYDTALFLMNHGQEGYGTYLNEREVCQRYTASQHLDICLEPEIRSVRMTTQESSQTLRLVL